MARHLAQFNTARLIAPLTDPRIAPFRAALARVNAIAERSPGFVWRLEGAGGDMTDLAPDPEGRVLPNLSVWEDVASLHHFVHNTVHRQFLARAREWFEPHDGPQLVLWHVAAGTRPTLEAGLDRLDRLRSQGQGPEGFGWPGHPPAAGAADPGVRTM